MEEETLDSITFLTSTIVPMMEMTFGWADETWAFRLWKMNPRNIVLEYLTFRELALQRKKCLTISQFMLERYLETRDVREQVSMSMYLKEANRLEKYMIIMKTLGHSQWTNTIDESIWPSLMCSQRLASENTICQPMSLDECKRSCDEWSASHAKIVSAPQSSLLDEWRGEALMAVARHWQKKTNENDM